MYEIIYYYFLGEKVFIPSLVMPYIFIPIFIFQVGYQITLLYELIFKKLVTKKVNFFFIVPIVITILLFNRTPFDWLKEYPAPELKIEVTMNKIALLLEKYRVKTFFYPKSEERFNKKIISKIEKERFITDYTTRRKKVPLKIYYRFDQSNYTNNSENYDSPSIIISTSGDGKHFWITSLVPSGYISKNEQFLLHENSILIIKDDIMIRKQLRDKLKEKKNNSF